MSPARPSPATPDRASTLARGYRECADLTRRHGTTYYWGGRLLPASRRRHVHAVYALARLADDLVDHPGADPGADLARFEARVWEAIEQADSDDPVLAAVATSVRETGIEASSIERFFRAMRTDLTRTTYETWDDLLDYMDGSAAVIGEMMLPVLDPAGQALRPARALGLAFQLTNFLRDVDEDLDRGRIYLPQEDLRRFGADPARRRVDQPWRELMRAQIERNRRLYREADDGIPLLSGGARRCVATARVLYARILDLIEDADYDVFGGRLAVPTPAKAALAARMVLTRDPLRAVRLDRAATRDARAGWADTDPVQLVDESGQPTGTGGKSAIHHDATPLHLAFSCYVFDADQRLLMTTRAHDKLVFPGVTTNTVCGHPLPGEPLREAVLRRVAGEVGLTIDPADLRLVLPTFRYRAAAGLIWENELCPVYVATVAGSPQPRPDAREVADAVWVPWTDYVARARTAPDTLSPWSILQVEQLTALGPDPAAWPAAPDDQLPPAARPGGGGA